ncbi:hypothetical protein [Solidesulfovibrio sp.]
MNANCASILITFAIFLFTTTNPGIAQERTDPPRPSDRTNTDTTTPIRVQRIGATNIYHLKETQSVYFFEATMQINADGAPKAYHENTDLGIDHLANAGSTGHWWGIVTDSGDADGKPILQGVNDPAPGFYVSGTSLQDSTKSDDDQDRYVDSETVPFYVLPKEIQIPTKIGDFGFVVNRSNNASAGCIFADVGPKGSISEGSIALAKAIGIPSDPKGEGSEETFVYVIFSNSSMGWPLDLAFIDAHAKALFEEWGGLQRLQHALPKTLTRTDKRH